MVRVNKKGWMDQDMFRVWLTESYGRRAGGFFRQGKSILVMDSIRAHITDTSKEAVKQTKPFLL